jgi:hypothetical protein
MGASTAIDSEKIGVEMGARNRGFYTKDIFCKQKMGNCRIALASISNQQQGSRRVSEPGCMKRRKKEEEKTICVEAAARRHLGERSAQ